MWLFIVFSMIAFGVAIVSHYWLKMNEFYEWKFPEIRKYSIISGEVALAIAIIWGIVSNIHIAIEMKEAKEKFINPYENHFIYGSKNIELFEDVNEIVFSNSAKYRTGSYQIRARRVNEQIALDFKNIREKEPKTLTKWFGNTDEDVNMVYCRDINTEIVSVPDTKQTYTFEFYYTDTEKREAWKQEYKQMIHEEYADWSYAEQDQLLNSFLAQADLDRAFDISKVFEVETDENGNLIITDEMKGFVRKNRLDNVSNNETENENTIETVEGSTVEVIDSNTLEKTDINSEPSNMDGKNR